ncbi:MAG: hypothetical protein WCH34_03265 [Bacteroidota bacterium]
MKRVLLFLFWIALSITIPVQNTNAQIAVTVTNPSNTTPPLSTTYPSLASAITAINAITGLSGPVIFNLAVGGTETAPAGGYVLGTSNLNALTSATKTITFQKGGNGVNPMITAFTPGTSTTTDGIWKLAGADYITIDGIDLKENASNLTSTTKMEWGYAFVKISGIDGAQNCTIKNCSITLDKANAASVGIYSGNHIATSTSSLTVSALSGGNSNNKIYGNTISNVFYPIQMMGYNNATFFDQSNEIGVTAGNTLSNFGGAISSYGIYIQYNNLFKISNNIITNTGTTTTLKGIYLASTSIASGDISNNNIQLNSSATTTQFSAIESAIAGTGTVNITGNSIHDFACPTLTSGNVYLLMNSGAVSTLNISGNTFSNNILTSTTGLIYGIFNNALVPNLSISGNAFTGNTINSTSGTFRAIQNTTANITTLNIYNNIIFNNTVNGTGGFYAIFSATATNANVYSNTINGNRKTGSSGVFYGIKMNGGTLSVHDNNIYNDSILSTSGAVADTLHGYSNSSATTSETIYNNNIHDLYLGGTSTSASQLYAIFTRGTAASTTKNIYSNQLYNLSLNTARGGLLSGVYNGPGGTININNNGFYNFKATGDSSKVQGMYIETGSAVKIYNNFISDIKNASAIDANAISGIEIQGGTAVSVYYNSIFLNAISSSATTFGTSGIYASTTPTLDLRNNIIVNNSTPIGTSLTVAFRRSGTNLTTYASTSNNNAFYAGTPNATHLIFFDGTNSDQTINLFKARVTSRDVQSFSELPPFVNISTTPYNIHLGNAFSTQCEGGAQPISGITTDYDGDTRSTTTPDVGADEGNFTVMDYVAPLITYTALSNNCSPGDQILANVNISDATGVPVTGNLVPRIYYKKNSGGSWYSHAGTLTSGTAMDGMWSFTMSASDMGGLTPNDVVNYFVIAQDASPSNNITSNPSTGMVASYVNNVTSPPTTPNSITIITTLAGTYTVGVSGNYPTLTAAVNSYNNSCLGGPVVFSLIDATYSSEAFPITINLNTQTNATNTLTIRPAASISSPVTISGTNATASILINGGKYVTIDGRPGGTGTNKYLVIENASTTAPTLLYINDASNNMLTYCAIKGGSDLIGFSTTTGTTGNSNNTISYCDIGGIDGSNYPKSGIYSSGTASKENSNIVITNNNIFDFRGATAYGINVISNSSDWTITNNNFYQSTAYAGIAGTTYGIAVKSGNNHLITGNSIGGSAPACGGSAWNVNASSVNNRFVGIHINAGTTTATSIQNNTIKNMSWLSAGANTGAPGTWCGMYLAGGNLNVGNLNGNIIGENTGTGSITITSSASNTNSYAILNASSNTNFISNNSIGSMTVTGSAAGNSHSLYVILNVAATVNIAIDNNLLGSLTSANSINAPNLSVAGSARQFICGIQNSSAGTVAITNNTIANINNAFDVIPASASGAMIYGIITGSGSNTITGNTIRNLRVNAPSVAGGTGGNSSVIGIALNISTVGGQNISQNKVYSLSSSYSGENSVTGIFYNGYTSGSNVVARNLIYSLELTSASTNSVLNGIYAGGGTTVFQNNMIKLGLKSDGSSITSSYAINGINDALGSNNYYFNSVYIGGSLVTGASATYAFNSASTTAREFENNIFYNARSNDGTATAKHYAVKLSSTGTLTLNYNDYFVNGVGGVLGNNGSDVNAIPLVSGKDANSINSNPMFVNPTAAIPDLHLTAGSPCTSTGLTIASITDDFDGNIRSANPNIGADEFISSVCLGAIGGTATGSTTFCLSGLTDISASGYSTGTGSTYQWQYSSNNFTSDIHNYTNQVNPASLTISVGSVTTYIRLKVTCATGIATAYSNVITITIINPAAPTGNALQSFNNTATVADLVATGSDIKWYNASTGGSLLSPTTALVNGGIYYASQSINGCESQTRLAVMVSLSKTVHLHLYLEGLFDISSNKMFEAKDIDWVSGDVFPKFGAGIADRIQINLYEENPPYASVGTSVSDVNLSTSGVATFQLPATYSGNYFIRVRTRNHIEAWSAIAIPFNTANINYDFSTSSLNAYQASGGIEPQAQVTLGIFAFYLGDLDQNLGVDFDDFNVLEPFLTEGTYGFTIADFNGSALVDFDDFNLFEPRLNQGPFAQYPGMVKK